MEKFKINYKKITVHTVDGTSIQGKINLEKVNRVSDIFKTPEPAFIVLKEAGLASKTLIINKSHIVWVEPEED